MAGARTIRRRMENALKGATGSDVIELTEYLLSVVPSPHFEVLLARAIKRHQMQEVEERLNKGLEIVSVNPNEPNNPGSGIDQSESHSDSGQHAPQSDSIPFPPP